MRQLYSIPAGLLLGILLALVVPQGAPYIAWLGQIFVSVLKLLILPLILVSIYASLAGGTDLRTDRRTRPALLPHHQRRRRHARHPDRPDLLPRHPGRPAGAAARSADGGCLQPQRAGREPHPEQPLRLAGGGQRPAHRLRRRPGGHRLPPPRRGSPRDPARRRPGAGRAADEDPGRRPQARPHRRHGAGLRRDWRGWTGRGSSSFAPSSGRWASPPSSTPPSSCPRSIASAPDGRPGRWSSPVASRCSPPSPPPPATPPTRSPSARWRHSASASGSPASPCRWARRSTCTAPRSTSRSC